MSDDFDDDLEDGDNPDESSVIRNLRKQARENAAAAKERDELRRELAFRDAGVPATKATSYFSKAYDGELTPDAIKAAAIEAGFLAAEDGATDDGPDRKDEEAAHERLAGVENGAQDASNPPGYEEELAAARTPEEALAVVQKYGSAVRG